MKILSSLFNFTSTRSGRQTSNYIKQEKENLPKLSPLSICLRTGNKTSQHLENIVDIKHEIKEQAIKLKNLASWEDFLMLVERYSRDIGPIIDLELDEIVSNFIENFVTHHNFHKVFYLCQIAYDNFSPISDKVIHKVLKIIPNKHNYFSNKISDFIHLKDTKGAFILTTKGINYLYRLQRKSTQAFYFENTPYRDKDGPRLEHKLAQMQTSLNQFPIGLLVNRKPSNKLNAVHQIALYTDINEGNIRRFIISDGVRDSTDLDYFSPLISVIKENFPNSIIYLTNEKRQKNGSDCPQFALYDLDEIAKNSTTITDNVEPISIRNANHKNHTLYKINPECLRKHSQNLSKQESQEMFGTTDNFFYKRTFIGNQEINFKTTKRRVKEAVDIIEAVMLGL